MAADENQPGAHENDAAAAALADGPQRFVKRRVYLLWGTMIGTVVGIAEAMISAVPASRGMGVTYWDQVWIHYGQFGFAGWILGLVGGHTVAGQVERVRRERWLRRAAAGRCIQCGYDLTGNVSGACTECGVRNFIREVETARSSDQRRGGVCAGLLVALLGVMTATAVRIEILNVAAGGHLPPIERHEDGWPVKWRVPAPPALPAGMPGGAGGSDEAMARRAAASGALRKVVSTWGLAQFALVPAALVLSLWVLVARRIHVSWRVLGGAGIVLAFVAGALILHRQYSASLGW